MPKTKSRDSSMFYFSARSSVKFVFKIAPPKSEQSGTRTKNAFGQTGKFYAENPSETLFVWEKTFVRAIRERVVKVSGRAGGTRVSPRLDGFTDDYKYIIRNTIFIL